MGWFCGGETIPFSFSVHVNEELLDTMNLVETDADAWRDLKTAGADAHSGFRFVNLCTVDANSCPQARLVVLRSADPKRRTIEIHTDIRSEKWTEISRNPAATILGFEPDKGLQLRLQGIASLHPPEAEIAVQAWGRLPPWTRATYTGGPPGTTAPESPNSVRPGKDEGSVVFGVIVFRANTLDWYRLARGDNRRAAFRYGTEGELTDSRWINP
jgi:pyridoxamine 5'-phosphate oxidase